MNANIWQMKCVMHVCMHSNKSVKQGLNLSRSQQQRLLYCLQYPVPYPSRLQVIHLFHTRLSLELVLPYAPRTRPPLSWPARVFSLPSRAKEVLSASSPSSTDSGLEAFSHDPADASLAPLASQPRAITNYPTQLFLSY
jgi:hypothetical protein